MKYSKYSIVIIGTGIAGLYTALKSVQALNLPDGILVITKSDFHESNSHHAQGGIVAVLKENKKDSVSSHISDTVKSGCGLTNFNVIKFVSENSETVIQDLLKCGVNFDRDENDNLKFTLEGAHCVNRILHAGGDATGKYIEKALSNKVLQESNTTFYERTSAVELLIDNNSKCRGVIAFNNTTKEYEVVYAGATILATGGCGQLFECTTNPKVATGDGIALAYNAGAVVQDMEFTQFHPTALALETEQGRRFLISEALRGEGAKLVDSDGRNFIKDYTTDGELAPRDIVTRAIYSEMKKLNTDKVFLNATNIPKDVLQSRFPTISQMCLKNGIDISTDYIPVAPAAHYMMGGIKTNIEGATSIAGLYAVGEVACTSLHGANRLASNSLLECVVCAYELANYLSFANLTVSNKIDDSLRKIIKKYQEDEIGLNCEVSVIKQKLRNIMWNNVGIYRTGNSLQQARLTIKKLKKYFAGNKKLGSAEEYELRNMLITAGLIVDFALVRKESRGAHCRVDFSETMQEAHHNYASITTPLIFEKNEIEDKIVSV